MIRRHTLWGGFPQVRTRQVEATVKHVWRFLGIILVIAALASCNAAQTAQPVSNTDTGGAAAPPPADRQGGDLDGTSLLALGTLELEGTADAVTASQAAELMPLWQVIRDGTLKSTAETEAVTKQIEGKMTASQLAAIEAMGLTMDDMQAWMQEQGIEMPAPQGDSQGGGPGGPGALGDLSEEERAQMREQFQNMSAEERATRVAEMGIQRPEGGEGAVPPGPGGARSSNLILGPLVELLTARAAG